MVFCIAESNAQKSLWNFSTGISPISRSGSERIFENPYHRLNMEWTNRAGIMVNDNLNLGLMGNIRYHSGKWRRFCQLLYDLQAKNTLWGTGPFLTRYFTLGDRFEIQATAFCLFEQGRGTFGAIRNDYVCPNCAEVQSFLISPNPVEPKKYSYKERNLFAGIELGGNYFLKERIAIQGTLTLFQFEDYETKFVGEEPSEFVNPKEYVGKSGNGFVFFTERPCFTWECCFC